MTERWRTMVEKVAMARVSETDPDHMAQYLTVPQAVKLLARQHRAFVRMVKKAYTYGPNFRGGMAPCKEGEWINVKDLLAALAKQGGK